MRRLLSGCQRNLKICTQPVSIDFLLKRPRDEKLFTAIIYALKTWCTKPWNYDHHMSSSPFQHPQQRRSLPPSSVTVMYHNNANSILPWSPLSTSDAQRRAMGPSHGECTPQYRAGASSSAAVRHDSPPLPTLHAPLPLGPPTTIAIPTLPPVPPPSSSALREDLKFNPLPTPRPYVRIKAICKYGWEPRVLYITAKRGMEFEQFKMTLANLFSMPVEVAFSISYRDMEGDDVALRPEADMSLLYEMADAVPPALRVTMCKP